MKKLKQWWSNFLDWLLEVEISKDNYSKDNYDFKYFNYKKQDKEYDKWK